MSVGRHVEIALPAMAVRPGERHDEQQRVHRRLVPAVAEQADRVDRPIDPEIVAVDRDKAIVADQRQRLGDAAAGLQQFAALVRDQDIEPFGASEMSLDRIGEVWTLTTARSTPPARSRSSA